MPAMTLLAVSVRTAFVASIVLGLFGSPALAGDRALVEFIGFSPDARYFAFEEFGIRDDSGSAYSSTYFVDLQTDSWVAGTPVRVIAEEGDDAENLHAIRSAASAEAQHFIDRYGITVPAEIAVLHGDGEPDGEPGRDPNKLGFILPIPEWGRVTREYSARLSTFLLAPIEECGVHGGPVGYELRVSKGPGEIVIHRDGASVPQSRGCPLGYRLYAVVVPGIGSTEEVGVIIVSYFPRGFEGSSRRFLAVPFLPDQM